MQTKIVNKSIELSHVNYLLFFNNRAALRHFWVKQSLNIWKHCNIEGKATAMVE